MGSNIYNTSHQWYPCTDVHAVHSTNYENKYVCRRFGVSTFWPVDVLVCLRFGLSTFWFVDVSVCRRFGMSTFWFVDVLVCRRFGLSTFRFVDIFVVDVSVCRRFDQLPRNPPISSGFYSHRGSTMKFSHFLWYLPDIVVNQTVKLPVI